MSTREELQKKEFLIKILVKMKEKKKEQFARKNLKRYSCTRFFLKNK